VRERWRSEPAASSAEGNLTVVGPGVAEQAPKTCALSPDRRRLLVGTDPLEVAEPGGPDGEAQVWEIG
jgi:hypothetical protein